MIIVTTNFLSWLLVAQIVLFIIQITAGFLYAKNQEHIIFEYLSFTSFGAIITIGVIVLFLVITS